MYFDVDETIHYTNFEDLLSSMATKSYKWKALICTLNGKFIISTRSFWCIYIVKYSRLRLRLSDLKVSYGSDYVDIYRYFCKPGAQSYSRSDTLVLSHASLDSYKYQYRSYRIFLEYAHLLYPACYLHPEEYTMVLTSCDRAQWGL